MISLTESLKTGFTSRVVTVVALLLLTPAPTAFADDTTALLQAFYKNKMPSSQQLGQSYANFTYTPLDRKDLTFSMAVPKSDWRDIPASLSPEMLKEDNQRLIPLAKQMAPENEKGEAEIEVVYMRMDLEISLYDYVDLFLQNYQTLFKVLARRDGRYNNRQVEEVLLQLEQNSKQYIVRATFYRHGNLFFGILTSALKNEFTRYAEPFTVAAVTFRMHQKAPHPYVEQMTAFSTKATPKLKFNCTGNWAVEEVPGAVAGIAAVDAKLELPVGNTQQMVSLAYIHARAVAKNLNRTPDRILNDLKEDFKGMPIAFNACTLNADLDPNVAAPLGKLERWEVTINGTPGEAAFLMFPESAAYIAMGLITTRPENNRLAWMHSWRIFELIAADLTHKSVRLTKLKSNSMPSQIQLETLVADTMNAFAESVKKGSFNDFYAACSTHFKAQITPAKLLQAFRGFSNVSEMDRLKQHPPVLKKETCLDKNGLLKLDGYCPTQPDTTTFGLTYIMEQTGWKLLGINVSMK